MNTQSHAIINVALLSRKDKPHLHLYALLGGVLPDLPMFIFFGIETLILKHSQGKISYWETDHYGQIASVVEILAIIVASVFLYPRLQSRLSRGALVTVNVISMLVYTAIVIFS